jgi:hypothetical protein
MSGVNTDPHSVVGKRYLLAGKAVGAWIWSLASISISVRNACSYTSIPTYACVVFCLMKRSETVAVAQLVNILSACIVSEIIFVVVKRATSNPVLTSQIQITLSNRTYLKLIIY